MRLRPVERQPTETGERRFAHTVELLLEGLREGGMGPSALAREQVVVHGLPKKPVTELKDAPRWRSTWPSMASL